MRLFIFRGALVIIIASTALCLYQMLLIHNTYVHEEKVHEKISAYAPPDSINSVNIKTLDTGDQFQDNPNVLIVDNSFLLDLKRSVNEDIEAWIRIPNSCIDYPIVYSEDNNFYLNHDVYRKYAAAGSIFIDKRNNKEFMDFNTIIYGHNMKNGTMFGELINFNNMGYFLNNPTAQIFLPDATYTLEIFAFIKLMYDDEIIYGSVSETNCIEFIKYVKSTALQYRDIQLSDNDRIVTLSTCTNDLADARIVLLARLNKSV